MTSATWSRRDPENLSTHHLPKILTKTITINESTHDSKIYNYSTNISHKYLPYIKTITSISSKPLSLLIDTGASISLISKSSIETLPEITQHIIKFKGIDSSGTKSTLGHIPVQFDALKYNFHIVDGVNLPYDGIIGNDIFNVMHGKIDYTKHQLILNKIPFKLQFNEPICVIPPRSETIIECTVLNPEIHEGLILDQRPIENLLIANCIVKIKENSRVNISVVNTSEQPLSFSSDLKLKLTPLDNIEQIQKIYNIDSDNPHNSNNPNDHNAYLRTKRVLEQIRIAHLNYEEKSQLFEVCEQFSDIFHLPGDLLTYTNEIKHEIKTTTSTPIHVKTYRFPECHKKEVNTQIHKMLEQGIIKPSASPWSSPIWVVPKKADASGEKKWRVVIDYRKLNDITIGDSYPIPNISEILDQLGKSKYFSTLDLASGFHQIQMNPEDSAKTAFTVPQGQFEFSRMPFGLKNAPSTFQRLMNSALSGLQGMQCFVYLDDIVIYSVDLDDHIYNLSNVFKRLRQYNLKLQPDKCEFLRKEVSYLGHIITDQGVKPNPDKIEAVERFPTPKTPKDIKSFLGFVSYYRRFISDFSKLAKPLTNLLKKDTPFLWENEQQLAFDALKQKLISAPLLAYPDFSKTFILTTDASNYAIGAILSQGELGKDRPIAYASRTLNKSECNYNTTEKELLAILFGCKTFRPYLYGRHFQIVTDHRPLKWLFNHKDPSSKLQRWRLKLEEYEYEIIYRKGKFNAADALSRYPTEKAVLVNPINPEPTPGPSVTDDNSPLFPESGNSPDCDHLLNPDAIPSLIGNPGDPLDLPDDLRDLNLEGLDAPDQPNENPTPNLPPTPDPNPPNISNDIIDPLNSPNLRSETYSEFLKIITDRNYHPNTKIIEHNGNLLDSPHKHIIIPTSIDFDESIPYTENIIDSFEDKEQFLRKERTLNSFLTHPKQQKTYYFLFTKVYHFDQSSYTDIFESLKALRNELILLLSESDNAISISDFKTPFDKHHFIKIYNMILYLFNNTNIEIHIYHNNIRYPTLREIKQILKDNHDLPIAGHLGGTRMLKRIQEKYYWKGMRSDVENYVKSCKLCQENKALRKISRAPMRITTTSSTPFQRLALDIVGPLPDSGPARLKYILTLQDDLTKYSIAYPTRSTTAEETCECLLHFISLFGIPKAILTDQGTNFTSELFKKTCNFLKIKQLWSSPYHPQTQGALERSHSTLKEYLKSFVNEDQDNWHRYVYTAMLSYNTSVHSTTNLLHPPPYQHPLRIVIRSQTLLT